MGPWTVHGCTVHCEKVNICGYCSMNNSRITPKRVKKKEKRKRKKRRRTKCGLTNADAASAQSKRALWFYSTLATKTFPYPMPLPTLCKLFLTLPFFLVRLMCAIRAHINKSIFEKVLLGQFSINFLQNWFYYYVPSHISKIAFFFSVIFPVVPIIANQSTKNKQSNTTLIYYLISTNSTLSLSIINIREL